MNNPGENNPIKPPVRGKFSAPGIPHRGWVCVGEDDLNDKRETCSMCESQIIRFVFTMRHTEYPEEIRAGRECAAYMQEDYEDIHRRERALAKRARRKDAWSRRKWRVSRTGNSFVNVNGFNIVVFLKRPDWHIKITDGQTGKGKDSSKRYRTEEQAMAGAFDALLFMESRRID